MYRILLFAAIAALMCGWILFFSRGNQSLPLPKPPDLRARNRELSLTLHAVADTNGRDAFAFNARNVAPILRVSPGDTLRIDYLNDLPAKAKGSCAVSPCMNMTNLHFHGFQVSPNAPQDDVLTMMAMPGQSLDYTILIPEDHPPGLYWYHTHAHGESHRQVRDGMSGAIVIEGMERYVPEVRDLPEQILIIRGRSISEDPQAASLLKRLEGASNNCGSEVEAPEEIFTVNGAIRPGIAIAVGERQFWRILNASADRYLDLQLDGQLMEIVALDGMPIAYHDPAHPVRSVDHFLVPPAGRLEAIVTGPPSAAHAALRSRCVDTGPDGDPNPGMVLADVVTGTPTMPLFSKFRGVLDPPGHKVVDLQAAEKSAPDFVATFTEDKKGSYINEQLYKPDSAPMRVAHVGTYERWRIVNDTSELPCISTRCISWPSRKTTCDHRSCLAGHRQRAGRRFGGRHHGFHRSCDSRNVSIPLPSAESRRQGHDGEDPLPVRIGRGRFFFYTVYALQNGVTLPLVGQDNNGYKTIEEFLPEAGQ